MIAEKHVVPTEDDIDEQRPTVYVLMAVLWAVLLVTLCLIWEKMA